MQASNYFFIHSMSRKRHNSEPCLYCYDHNHLTANCTDLTISSCSKCFKLNVSEDKCNCEDFQKPHPLLLLRLAGDSHAPRWFMDLEIHGRKFIALVNSALIKGRVRRDVALWMSSVSGESTDLNKETITLKVDRNDLILRIPCDIIETQEHDINLGADVMKFFGYTFTMDHITLDSKRSYVSPSPYHINYGYNIPDRGEQLRKHLQSKPVFLRQPQNIMDHYGVPSVSSKKQVITIGLSSNSDKSSDSEHDDSM